MKSAKDLCRAFKVLDLAAKAEAQIVEASQEAQTYRLAGRLARDPHNVAALSQAIVNGMKRGDPVISIIIGGPRGRTQLHFAMQEVSMQIWQDMWNDTHPNQFGLAWESEDIALKSVWREKVRIMIMECHEECILAMTVEEYFSHLTATGESEEIAGTLADWISTIHLRDTPST